jgi:hypothetical protein
MEDCFVPIMIKGIAFSSSKKICFSPAVGFTPIVTNKCSFGKKMMHAIHTTTTWFQMLWCILGSKSKAV